MFACSLTSFRTASNDGLPMNGVISSLMPLSWIELGFLSTSCHSKSHYCSWILISSPGMSRKQHISRAPEVSLLTECSNRSLIGLDLRTNFNSFYHIHRSVRRTSSSNRSNSAVLERLRRGGTYGKLWKGTNMSKPP